MTRTTITQRSWWARLTDRTADLPPAPDPQWPKLDRATATIDIVVPCHNEAATLAVNIERLLTYLAAWPLGRATVTIADSGSTDQTWAVAQRLAARHAQVRLVREDQKGRGRALKAAWRASRADILVYMDEDLSTDLRQLPALLAPLLAGTAPVAVGSRLAPGAQTSRSPLREGLSRGYVWLLKHTLGLRVSDAQCGFKAIRRDAATRLLDGIADDGWFFDTELIIKSQRLGWSVTEVPVTWREDRDSRVQLLPTIAGDLRGIDRLRREAGAWLTLERLAVGGLLGATAGIYLWHLAVNGYANSYYAAAVQAATVSWKAFFFGSIDAANYITIDKPPAAIWAMALSTRLLGFSSFAMLLPEALAGVGTVALTYAAVRRVFGFKEAFIAGAVLALTPVAALMFRFNNPDALLTLLLAAGAYAVIRALGSRRRAAWWLVAAGGFTGLAFDTKMLQGLMLVPVLGLVYLVAARPRLIQRLWHLAAGLAATAVATLWWPVAVMLTPAANRPYIGGSTSNNLWDLVFGYNGLARILGRSATTGAAGTLPSTAGAMAGGQMGGPGGAGRTGFGGSTGVWRLFNGDFGPGIAWLIPFALITIGLVVWLARRLPRTDSRRAAVFIWGGWLLVHMVVFSFMSGTIHPYYPVVMAPAIAALVGIGAPLLWESWRRRLGTAWLLPATVLITAVTAFAMLSYNAAWLPWLRWTILGAGAVTAAGLAWSLTGAAARLRPWLATAAVVVCLAAPVAMSAATIAIAHTGSIPTAGPKATAMAGSNNERSSTDQALSAYLLSHQDGATWIAAAASANESAAIQLSTGQPVMAVGGFMGSDQAITLSQFQQLVADGKLKYYVVSSLGGQGGGGFGGGPGGQNQIATWVQANGTAISYGGSSNVTLYQL